MNAEQIEDARVWMEKVLGEEVPKLDQPTLKSGVILLKMSNKVLGKNAKIQTSKMPFVQMENIAKFLEHVKELGCPDFESFQTIDLFENKRFESVLTCIYSFARIAKKQGKQVPSLGPDLVEKRTLEFTEEQLNVARNTISLQNKGSVATQIQAHMPRNL